MKNEIYEAANLILEKLQIKTNCFDNGKILPAKYIVAVDDDATSGLWAAFLYYLIRRTYGYCPIIICVGGKGPLSKHMLKTTEGQMQKDVVMALGIPEENTILCDKGRHTGENIYAVNETVGKEDLAIWALTSRLSLRMSLSIEKQAPELNSKYFVIKQTLEEIMESEFNGKGVCKGLPIISEVAAIRQRLIEYQEKGVIAKWDDEMDTIINQPKVIAAAELLEDEAALKVNANGSKAGNALKTIGQFVQIFLAIKTTAKKRKRSLYNATISKAVDLFNENLIGLGDSIHGVTLENPEQMLIFFAMQGRQPFAWNTNLIRSYHGYHKN
ncbi:MAG: ElyC/SanA/YdcF family protein [Alphaproteobacteria bacterium]